MIKIGQKLVQERINKNLSLEEISKATKIRTEFLEAIEKGDHKKLPSTAYAYGFVRNYAKFLGFDEKESLALFKREFDADKAYDVLPKGFSKKDEFPLKKIKIGRSVIIGAGVLLLIAAFLLFRYKSAILNPSLEITYPTELSVVQTQDIKVEGKTDSNTTVYIQDELVNANSSGRFSKDLTLFPGRTTITVKAVNRFGRTTVLERHIEVKPGY